MNLVRLRNGKTRLLAGLLAGVLLLIFTFVVHDTHTKLIATRSQAQDCERKQESLSAQLQVVYEHRTRLEKALQQEKLSHKQTKDKLEAQYEELQEQADKEKQESQSKHNVLQQQYKAVQSQQEDLHEEFSKLQQTNAELQEEKQNLVNKLTSQMDQLRMAKDEEILQLQNSIVKLQQEKEDLVIKMDQTPAIRQLEAELVQCRQQVAEGSKPTSLLQTKVQVPSGQQQSMIESPALPQVKPKDFHLPNKVPEKTIPLVDGHPEKKSLLNTDGSKLSQQILQQNVVLQPHHNPPGNVIPAPIDFGKIQQQPPSIQETNEGHQLANPQDADIKISDDNHHKQLEGPNRIDGGVHVPKKQQIAEPPVVLDGEVPHRGALIGHDAEFVANGLEQQENGDDQDLDDVDNEIQGEKRENNQFEDADFDQDQQDDNDGNRNNQQQHAKQEGVIAAPH